MRNAVMPAPVPLARAAAGRCRLGHALGLPLAGGAGSRHGRRRGPGPFVGGAGLRGQGTVSAIQEELQEGSLVLDHGNIHMFTIRRTAAFGGRDEHLLRGECEVSRKNRVRTATNALAGVLTAQSSG